ncbi:MAG: glycosyltransferase, partial [Thermosynechococcaceae cyanobacterium]
MVVAYNAVSTLAKVLSRVPEDVWANVAEVVVFDDASQDNTYELGLGYKIASEINNLKIFRNAQNLGYGGNQKLGYQYFIDHDFDVVVLLHGDGQYAPEILSHLYHPIVEEKADAVFGSRMMSEYGGPLNGGMPIYKYVGNRILTSFENRALGMNLTEFHSGYRAYSIAALREIDFSKMTDDFHFDTEIIIKLNHQNFNIKEVPIPTYYGKEICYVDGLKYAADVAQSVIHYKQSVNATKCHAVYQEYFPNYPLKSSKYSSHHFFAKLVGSGHQVLDIGCGEGFLSTILARQNQVYGIDILDSPQHIDSLQNYIKADLQLGLKNAWSALRQGKAIQGPVQQFDAVLLPDVLEHLCQPERLLQDCHRVLASQGRLLVSV